jgi:nucleoside-diphosphate-sugar epimerase
VRILLTGRNGQIGSALERALAPLGEVTALARADLDLQEVARIGEAVRAGNPDVIINAAAYTAVDKAESERDAAFAVNATAPGALAEEARRAKALLVHYSTDYVFDGAKPAPYVEEDEPNPINAYGASKLAGERAIAGSGCRYLILRTSWVYGPRGANFYLTMLRLARERRCAWSTTRWARRPRAWRSRVRRRSCCARARTACITSARAARRAGAASRGRYLGAPASPRPWSPSAPRTTRRRRGGRATRAWTARGCARTSAWRWRRGRSSSPS